MDKFAKNRVFVILIYILLGLFILYMLQLIHPMIYAVYDFLKTVLAPFIIAMIISYVLNPVVRLLHHRRVPRTIAILLIYTVFIGTIVIVLMNVTPMFMRQLKELNEHLPELTVRVQNWMDGVNDNKFLPDSVRMGIKDSLSKVEQSISQVITTFINKIGTTLNAVFIAFIIPFLAFYMLKDYQMIEKTVLAVVPKAQRKQTIKLLIDIDNALGNYVRGQFIVCLVVGMMAYIGYWIIGMPYPLLLAGTVAVFNIIPYLGPFFGAAPALIVASTISWKMVLFVILINMIVQNLEGNIISPQIVGKKLKMHPLLIILALLVGGELAGVVGLILAVPIFAVMKVTAQHMYLHYMERKRP